MHIIAPSLLAADFSQLRNEIERVNQSDADWFHIDIMDGQFVPNFSIGTPVLKSIKKYAKKPLDVHLMIVEPDRYIEHFVELGADILTVHIEATHHLHRTIEFIKSFGIKAGISMNPHTPVHLLDEILGWVDMVLVMTVNPGFGAQTFIPSCLDKIQKLSRIRAQRDLKFLIEVDGGVDMTNALTLVEAGANVLVAGNTVFSSKDPGKMIHSLKHLS